MKDKKFKRSMLEYSKLILYKMSFDRELVRKEYSKAVRHLNDEERIELQAWAQASLGSHLTFVAV